jgi:DNA-binding MarR family transcriptional regulator
MVLSELETYIAILKILAQKGPLRSSQIANETRGNLGILKGHLGFLQTEGYVEKRIDAKRCVIYAITKPGVNVLNFFRQRIQMSFTLARKATN